MVAPVLCSLLLREKIVSGENKVMTRLDTRYRSGLQLALAYPWPIIIGAIGLLIFSLCIIPQIGTEFLPHLDEGNLWLRATMPSTVSYGEGASLMPRMRAIIASFQPVKMVVSQLGRPDDGSDSTGFYNAEFFVDLKPYDQWQGIHTKDELIREMNAQLTQMLGIGWNFSQDIEDNVEEAVTGVKGELAVKLFGDDLNVMQEKAAQIQSVMATVPGVVDLTTFSELGEPQVQVVVNRDKCARYGLNVADIQNVVQTAIGGNAVTQVLQGERQFDVVVRLMHKSRSTVDEIRDIQVDTPDGYRIPLSDVTDVRVTTGASFIYREASHRYIAIKFGVRGRDLGGTIAEAQAKVRSDVSLPPGYYTEWGGEYESLQRAEARLEIIIPATLVLIFIILFLLFKSVSRPLLVMLNVPLALMGGIFALYITHFHFSVSAAVGFISVFGIAVQNGVLMVSQFEHQRARGTEFQESIIEGAVNRLRAVMMTAILASVGLLPAALSTGIGSDVQKPIAIVIIGGLMTEPILTLFVLPVVYSLVAKRVVVPISEAALEAS
jgi:cobalt-zinc-cadmium resistance protein CzcA